MTSVAVTITTKNRRDELRRTLGVVAALEPPADEVLVCADGCTDGTGRMVRAEFPGVRLTENIPGRGSVASRDALLRAATSDWALSLDDDSYPVGRDFVARLREVADAHPEAAVLTFHQESDEFPETLANNAPGPGRYVHSFANSAAALRRADYLNLPGYSTHFGHVYEEPDYALQCHAAGQAVWLEPSLTIRHHWTATGRSERRNHARQARNEQWSAWARCPLPWLPAVAAYRAASQARYALRRGPGWLAREPLWWASALGGVSECRRRRAPVPWRVYRAWLRLGRRPLLTLDEWKAEFAP